MKDEIKSLITRYCVGTLGLVLVAIGVALSIKSDLGTAPISCPPYVTSLAGQFQIAGFTIGTIGQYTILMHFCFILLQLILLGRKFKLSHLMQIPAAIVFGTLTDVAVWAMDGMFDAMSFIDYGSYAVKAVLMILSILITALGISFEVLGNAWMLAGEMTDAAIADRFKIKFRNAKVIFDILLVIVAAGIALACFGNPLGNNEVNVIREGTVMSAIFTGLCMRFTDKLAARMLPAGIKKRL